MKKVFLWLVLSVITIGIAPLTAQQTSSDEKNFYEVINSKLLFNENIKIVNLGPLVNNRGLDYAPTVTLDGKTIYFVSNRPGCKLSVDGKYSHDLWAVKKKDRLGTEYYGLYNIDTLSKGTTGLNTSLNEGAASISTDGRRMYFTGCNRPDGRGDCDIYVCYFDGENWSKPINLGPSINSMYWDSQPSISPYDRRLYFVSDRPIPGESKDGDMDIWYSDWDEDNGLWKPARNLTAINTDKQEFSPYIAADGVTLFFASKGYKPNYGGFDFYVTKYDKATDTWSAPKNLGKPINTEKDDFFLSIPGNGDIIYFSSKRTDIAGYQGDFDLYMAYLPGYNAENIHIGSIDGEVNISTPNPFNKDADINIVIQKESRVTVKIYNVYREEIKVLEDKILAPDKYKLNWDGKDSNGMEMPSGVYYCTVITEAEGKKQTESCMMMLVW